MWGLSMAIAAGEHGARCSRDSVTPVGLANTDVNLGLGLAKGVAVNYIYNNTTGIPGRQPVGFNKVKPMAGETTGRVQ